MILESEGCQILKESDFDCKKDFPSSSWSDIPPKLRLRVVKVSRPKDRCQLDRCRADQIRHLRCDSI